MKLINLNFLTDFSIRSTFVFCYNKHGYKQPDLKTNFISNNITTLLSDSLKLEISFKPATYIFSGVGASFPKLKKLLVLDRNVKHIQRNNFDKMHFLEWLVLSENLIEFVPHDTFFDLPNLKRLYLQHNQIKQLSSKVFMFLVNLEYLELSKNALECLKSQLFERNPRLKNIFLEKNNLISIGVNFTKLPISKIFLHNNTCFNGGFIKNSISARSTFKSINELQTSVDKNCTNLCARERKPKPKLEGKKTKF